MLRCAAPPPPPGRASTRVSGQDVSGGEPCPPAVASGSRPVWSPSTGRGRVLGPGGGQSRPLVLHVLKSQPFTTQIQGPANQQGGLGLARPSLETGVHSQSHHLSAKGLATQGAEQPRRRDGPGGQAHHTASLPRQRRRARNQTNREGVARDTAAVNTGARAGDPRSAQTMSHARTRPLTQKLHFRCHALQTPLGLSRKGRT